MQNAHQQHFSLFNWETHATAHKSSSTRTSAVVCEPGETAHKTSSRRTVAVVCEPCETAHKMSPNLPFARVVWEPRASAYHTCRPEYLSSVRRDSPCRRRGLIVTAFREHSSREYGTNKKGPCFLSLLSQQNPCCRPPRCSSLVCAHTLSAHAPTAPTPMCRAWTGRRVMVSWMLAIAQ